MGAIERITITLPAEMAAAVKETVAEGEYASASEVIREALRDWTRARDTERRELEALREMIRIGDESGPSVPAEEVYAELRQLIADIRATKS
jgi:antitoxin ParD1/3/4